MIDGIGMTSSAATMKLPRRSAGTGDQPACPSRLWRIVPAVALGFLLLLSHPAQPAVAVCPAPATVTQEVQLNNAIDDFNAATAPCAAVIELGANIFLSNSTTPIDNATANVSLTIDGQGFKVDGDGISGTRPFQINAGTTVVLSNITVTGGNIPESAGATPFNRGGGILNLGTLTLVATTVSGNQTDRGGGGIVNLGTLTVLGSTISGNTVTGYSKAGGLNGTGQGGGIDSRPNTGSSTLTIRNSTVSGNQVPTDGAGVYLGNGTFTFDSVTITENSGTTGAGIWIAGSQPGTLTIGNSVVEGNPPFLNQCTISSGGMVAVVDQGFNLFGPGSCGLVNGVNGNIVGANSQLLPLADNGGPTQTHAPKLDSPVLDAGSTTLTTDQRGQGRPVGPAKDIGAFESTRCGGDTWTVDDKPTLNTAIACFNAKTAPGTYTINVAKFIVTAPAPTVINNATVGVELVIEGNGQAFDSGGNLGGRALEIAANTTVTVNHLVMSGGNVNDNGGAILNAGTLNLNDCSIDNSTAHFSGGAIYNSGVLVIDRSSFWSNLANGAPASSGGAIAGTGPITIRNSTVSGNTATGHGGGIASGPGALTLDSVTIYDNTAPNVFGSGISFIGPAGAFSIKNSILAGNKGGAPDCDSSTSSITNNGNNLVQLPGNCGFVNGVNGDIVGQAPLLSSLGPHGGTTYNHALLPGSAALNHGDTSLTVDQRGFPRPIGAADDIGSYEEQQFGTITVAHLANPMSDINFDYVVSGQGLSFPFQVNDSTTPHLVNNLPAGSYTVRVFPSNTGDRWAVVSIDCGGAPGVVISVPDGTAVVPLAALQQVTCSFEVVARTKVTASVIGGGGSVSCSPPTYVLPGGDSHCTAVPDPGFTVQAWGGACASFGNNAQCALSNIGACVIPANGPLIPACPDQTSTVTFGPIPAGTHTVSASVVGGGGAVSCLPAVVQDGQSSTCYAVPSAGFQVASWGGACASWGSNGQCYLTKIQADQVSTVSFEPIPPATFGVSASVVGGNGSASCLPTSVQAGQSSTCFAVPNVGYQVQGWTGACAAAGTAGQCNLTNIQANKVSTVSFSAVVLPTYTVSATAATPNGTVSCAPGSVTQGDSASCTAVPAPGFQVSGWTGACASTGTNVQCFLPSIQQNQMSTVSFAAIPPGTHSVSASVTAGSGSVSCDPGNVPAGGASTCTAVPAAGFQVQSWGGACASWGHNVQCSLSKIQSNQVASVSFAPILPGTFMVTATVDAGGGGAVACLPNTVQPGGFSTCFAFPYVGYAVQSWSGACAAAGGSLQCDLDNIQSNQASVVTFSAVAAPTHTIGAMVGVGNGTVSCAPTTVSEGDSATCTAVPMAGSRVKDWTGSCASTGTNVQCALAGITANQSSTVNFEAIPPNTFTVTATAILGRGTVRCDPGSVASGEASTCTATPESGYQVQSWGGDCVNFGNNAQCYLPDVTSNKVSTVSFAPIIPALFSISATVVGGHGLAICAPSPVTKGGQSTCTAVPDAGYQVNAWTGACVGAGSSPQCYLAKIQKHATSTVSFVPILSGSFLVSATVVGGNGMVSCTPVNVAAGESSTCTAVPDPGYQVQGWAGDCALAGSNAQCGLTNIQVNKSSTVSFTAIPPNTYTVSASVVGVHGSVSCAPDVVVKGDSSNCTAVPDAGYRVSGWTGDCATTGTNVQCHLANVQKNSSSTVSFATIPPGTFTVTATVGVGVGSAGCAPTIVAAGGNSTCTADPGPGFVFAGWGGACAGAGAVCTFTNIQSSKQSTASFAASLVNTVGVSAFVGAGQGAVSCTPPSVGIGGTITCTAVPDPANRIIGWTGACAPAGKSPQCVLTNVVENETVSVLFLASRAAPAPLLSGWGLAVSALLLLAVAALRLRASTAARE